MVNFVHPVQYVLTLDFDGEVLYGNVALSVVVRSTKEDIPVL